MNGDGENQTGAMYRAVWRWHFYAGLFTAPVLIALAVTGALYLFSKEIEGWWYRDLIAVPLSTTSVAASAQEAAVLAAYPGAKVKVYSPASPGSAAEWSITTAAGKPLAVFVDPSDGAVKGAIAAETRLMTIVRDIHAGLYLGDFGRYVVELSACWALVLLGTGLYLWWPRGGRGLSAFVPRLGAGSRTFWRDLHAVPSLWNLPLIAFLILSGLPWSIFWGNELASLGTLSSFAAPTPNFMAQPRVDDLKPKAGHDHGGDQPWAIRHAPEPAAHHGAHTIGIDHMMAEAKSRGLADGGLRVFYPGEPGATFTLSYVPATAQGQRTVNIDPTNGAVLRDVGWSDYSALGMAVEFGVMTHMGQQFGVLNQFLMLGVCILFICTIGAGYWMWWQRRPLGGLGAPQPLPGSRAGWGLLLIILAAMAIFPLVALSIMAIAAIELGLGVLGRRQGSP